MNHKLLALFLLFVGITASAQKQRFFNLTVEDIKIDSVLPEFRYSLPIGEHYADSTYELEIRYPEFMDMSRTDIARYNALSTAKLPALPVITQQVVVERKRGALEFSLVPIVERGGKKQFLVSFMIALTSKPINNSRKDRVAATRAAADVTERYAAHSVLAQGKWAKIRVAKNGIYEITPALIKQAGFSDVNKVKIYGYGGHLQGTILRAEKLKQYDDLKEVESTVVNGKRLFYGKGPVYWENIVTPKRVRNPYSQYGYYFLTEGEPKLIDNEKFLKSVYPLADDYHELHEIDNFAWFPGGNKLFEDTPIALGKSHTYTIPNASKSTAGVMGIGVSTGKYNSTVEIKVNGRSVGVMSVKRTSSEFDFGGLTEQVYPLNNLQTTDSITIRTTSGGPVRLDYIAMNYNKPKPAPDLNSGKFSVPEYVHNITNQDHHADVAVDMVIIIPTSQKLLKQAQRLAKFHEEHDGLRVKIVPADELYNEFSSGTPSASAYRHYLKMLYDRATTDADMPKSLLLFGDCVWDNRMLTAECKQFNPDDYLLAFESDNSFSLTNCYVNDGWFTLLDDGEGADILKKDKEDVGVGRFPVVLVEDAKTVVDKTINYTLNKNAGNWENVIMFMGDDGNGNLHMRDVDETAETISKQYPAYHIKKVMWDAYTRVSSSTGHRYPEVTNIIKQQQAQGALIMDYAGHGSEIQISHEAVLRITDFTNFTNANLPLWVTASCDIMPFDGTIATIGEEAMLNKKGGAVAFWGTTRTVYAHFNKFINTAFLTHVLSMKDGKPTTLGEAQRLAKCDMINVGSDRTRNKLQYSLLGDPALKLNLPQLSIQIDSINGMAINGSEKIVLKGGAIAKVKGHVVHGNEKASDFNGLMTATVRDTEELITCKQQESTDGGAFLYTDRQKVLYNGSDSVRNGEFKFTFAVPRDLNYADGAGLINVYAMNNDRSLMANGSEGRFYINGSEQVSNDSIGPSIYCYLNTPSFVNGGNVNPTPYFVAEVTDQDGINATGNGVGHDLQLTIDGEMARTYNLNDNFTFEFGSYTKGKTYYSIPELPEGRHQLKFRVWDILNNSSTAVLDFNVVKSSAPDIESISCTKNPASTETAFIVTHNYINANVDVTVEVFDTSGRILWSRKQSATSVGNSLTMDWDLRLDNGAKLQTGVYLYRVRLCCGNAERESKAKKLIIINNK